MRKRGKVAQIWVETVVYTLIALSIIGLVLAFVKPKIEEIQDKTIIEQSIVMMENIDAIVLDLDEGGEGNKRLIQLVIKRGLLKIDSGNDTLSFELNSASTYSEPGRDIVYGDLIIHTEKIGKTNKVSLIRNYTGIYNITFQLIDQEKEIAQSSTPYSIFISNRGKIGGQPLIVIDFEFV